MSEMLDGDLFPEVNERVNTGDTIRVTYPTDDGTATVSGEVTEIRTKYGKGNQSIRFKNENGVYLIRDFAPSTYSDSIAEDKSRSIRVLKDLNPNGKTHLHGLNEQGDPAIVEVLSQTRRNNC